MGIQHTRKKGNLSKEAEEKYLEETLAVVKDNLVIYGREVSRMQDDIDEMLAHYHDNDTEVLTILNNTVTMHEHMKRALMRNERALSKPYFGRIIFHDEVLDKEESIYIGRGGIARDTTHWMVVDWRAPVANAYYENGLGRCSYEAPGGTRIRINLELKRTYEIDGGKLQDYFDSEVIANDELLTKYLARNKQAVLSEIVATIQKEQNEIIRKSPYHNVIVQGVAGSGKTTVAMHRISYILYNYEERFKPDDFYIVGSNRILLNYITGVLPDLDVYGIRQMTMEQLFVRLLYEDWDDKKYCIKGRDAGRMKKSTNTESESVKGTSAWFKDLEDYCQKLEWDTICCKSIYLNPRQFVEGIKDGKIGVFDESAGQETDIRRFVCLIEGEAVERYVRQNPGVSIQSKINMLNSRLRGKIKEEFLGKDITYTEAERKAILKAYRGHYGGRVWKQSIFELYQDFLRRQQEKGYDVGIPDSAFDVYDLAALAYLYKRVKETEVISEAHHIVIDEAQDFGMMAYHVLNFCIYRCTYTIMGDISQNIHFGCGLNDWEELKKLLLPDSMDSFGILKKSYRNTVEISDFATNILHHGRFSIYPVEPIIRHGSPVEVRQVANSQSIIRTAAEICRGWQTGKSELSDSRGQEREGAQNSRGSSSQLDTIAVVCRDQEEASRTAQELSRYIDVIESDPEKTEFGSGIMVLPVEYTKGLEFDAVLILDPTREKYPVDDGHAKLLYVAATRALHELCVLHTGNLTGLIADPVSKDIVHSALSADSMSDPSGTIDPDPAASSSADSVSLAGQISDVGSAKGLQSRNRHKKNISIVYSQLPGDGNTGRPEGKSVEKMSGKPVIPSRTALRGSRQGMEQPQTRQTSRQGTEQPQTRQISRQGMEQPQIQRVFSQTTEQSKIQHTFKQVPVQSQHKRSTYAFGDMPVTQQLRPPGHSKIDLTVKWVTKKPDGLYLHSRYGILRLSPIGSAIIRVTFEKGAQMTEGVHAKIAARTTDRRWMYKETGSGVDLMTDELFLQVDKASGAIRYMTRDRKLLLAERNKECRQVETGIDGRTQTWLYLEWQKKETVYGMGAGKAAGINLRGSARYISGAGAGITGKSELPFILSDQGYGMVIAADDPVMSCDIPAYGTYIHGEDEKRIDFYFITGRRQSTIMNAYAYLCGKL